MYVLLFAVTSSLAGNPVEMQYQLERIARDPTCAKLERFVRKNLDSGTLALQPGTAPADVEPMPIEAWAVDPSSGRVRPGATFVRSTDVPNGFVSPEGIALLINEPDYLSKPFPPTTKDGWTLFYGLLAEEAPRPCTSAGIQEALERTVALALKDILLMFADAVVLGAAGPGTVTIYEPDVTEVLFRDGDSVWSYAFFGTADAHRRFSIGPVRRDSPASQP